MGSAPQPSLFSAELSTPAAADLGGLLCSHGQVATFAGTAARLSVVVDARWRAQAIAAEFAARALPGELAVQEGVDDPRPVVRTPFLRALTPLATAWTRGAVKSVPSGCVLDAPTLRLWLLAGGRRGERTGYELELDPRAPETHQPVLAALERCGLRGVLRGPRQVPVVRLTGKRRLGLLSAMVGDAPAGGEAYWPC